MTQAKQGPVLTHEAFFKVCGGNKTNYLNNVSQIIKNTIDYILDGEESLDLLEACEKAMFGVKFEKRFVRRCNLPQKISKKKNPHGLVLDSRIDDIDFDIKCTLGGNNWMIPGETLGYWCLLIAVDYHQRTFKVGLFKAVKEHMTARTNRDLKYSISKEGMKHITWLTDGDSNLFSLDRL